MLKAKLPGHTPERETAEELGQTIHTLRSWRKRGVGPPYTKVGKQILYPDDLRAAWVRSRLVRPVQETVAA